MGDVWVMQNTEVDIKQQISKEIQKLKRFAKPKISFKWLSIAGVVPKTNENSFIITNNNISDKLMNPENNDTIEIEKNIDKTIKEIHIIESPNILLSQVFFNNLLYIYFF